PAGRVHIASTPQGGIAAATALAAHLLSDRSAVASPAASADASGVFNVSPAEVDETGRPIGEQPMYAIRLAWPDPTTDGGPKRQLVCLAHIHAAGEATSWMPFRFWLDWLLDSESEEAAALRANWDVHLYFACTP